MNTARVTNNVLSPPFETSICASEVFAALGLGVALPEVPEAEEVAAAAAVAGSAESMASAV